MKSVVNSLRSANESPWVLGAVVLGIIYAWIELGSRLVWQPQGYYQQIALLTVFVAGCYAFIAGRRATAGHWAVVAALSIFPMVVGIYSWVGSGQMYPLISGVCVVASSLIGCLFGRTLARAVRNKSK